MKDERAPKSAAKRPTKGAAKRPVSKSLMLVLEPPRGKGIVRAAVRPQPGLDLDLRRSALQVAQHVQPANAREAVVLGLGLTGYAIGVSRTSDSIAQLGYLAGGVLAGVAIDAMLRS